VAQRTVMLASRMPGPGSARQKDNSGFDERAQRSQPTISSSNRLRLRT
jgi:hypothetical protein